MGHDVVLAEPRMSRRVSVLLVQYRAEKSCTMGILKIRSTIIQNASGGSGQVISQGPSRCRACTYKLVGVAALFGSKAEAFGTIGRQPHARFMECEPAMSILKLGEPTGDFAIRYQGPL